MNSSRNTPQQLRQRQDRVIGIILILAIQLVMLALISAASASTPPAALTSLAEAQPGDPLKLKGRLTCNMGAANTGEPCVLLFSDADTGRSLHLSAGLAAMRAYFDGHRLVTITGQLVRYDEFELSEITWDEPAAAVPSKPAPDSKLEPKPRSG